MLKICVLNEDASLFWRRDIWDENHPGTEFTGIYAHEIDFGEIGGKNEIWLIFDGKWTYFAPLMTILWLIMKLLAMKNWDILLLLLRACLEEKRFCCCHGDNRLIGLKDKKETWWPPGLEISMFTSGASMCECGGVWGKQGKFPPPGWQASERSPSPKLLLFYLLDVNIGTAEIWGRSGW